MARELPTGTVTLLFTDIEGSTALLEALGDAYGDLLADHHRLLREVWTAHDGAEVGVEGDAFFVSFARAQDAVDAAGAAQRALANHAWPAGAQVRVRMGVHTGTPQVRDGQYWGRDIHYGARVGAAAHGGQVLVSAAAAAQVEAELESLGEHALKDFPDPRPLLHLVVDGQRADAFPPPRTRTRRRANLPVTSAPLIGRDAELDELEALVRDRRLVTVSGPGGAGKTRFTVELAHRLVERFADGATFVPLEELTGATAVPTAIARALGLPDQAGSTPEDRVAEHVAEHDMLLVLDNFEHVVDAAPVVARLAVAGDGGRVVVTSQAPLRVTGEAVYELGPLASDPSVALLVERARAAAPDFELTAENAPVLAELCERLEGMPLAIELAAARLGVLDPAALLRRVDAGLDALGTGARDLPPRQRGLRAVLEWTASLLTGTERASLARLSVFSGGFTLELAEAAFGDLLDEVAALRDVGLVRRGSAGRLVLRPPVRRYAAELLAELGAEHEARLAHARALADFVEPWEARWMAKVHRAFPLLQPELSNALAALEFARAADVELHARLAAATGWWMTYAGLVGEGRAHVEPALDAVEDPRLRARLLEALGILSLTSADPGPGERAIAAWRDLGDDERLVTSLAYLANIYSHAATDRARELEVSEQAVAVATAMGDDELLQMACVGRAQAYTDLGRYDEACAEQERLIAVLPEWSFVRFWAATDLADTNLQNGRPGAALRSYGVAMQIIEPLPAQPFSRLMQADTAAVALLRLGRLDEAALAFGICEIGHAEIGVKVFGTIARLFAEGREGLSSEAYADGVRRARELGFRAGLDWVQEVALAEPDAADTVAG